MGGFAEKVALVTGGSSGIGRATALAFAREGARIVIAARRADLGEQAVAEIKAAGGEAMFIQTDVSKAGQVEAMVGKAISTYGRLDCAFNNAGIAGTLADTVNCTEESWDENMNINLKSVWLCMRQELVQMLKQGSGAIVNTASAAGLVALPGATAYCVAKAGVIGLTKTAAIEYVTKGIRINCVCPSFVGTPLTMKLGADYPEFVKKAFVFQPIQRVGTPDEIAAAVVWLCSDAASFVTGAAFSVDGGYVAQ